MDNVSDLSSNISEGATMQSTSIYPVVNRDTITQSVQRLKATGLTQVEVASALAKGIATVSRYWNRGEVDA